MKQVLAFVLLLSISQYSCQPQSDQSLQADGPKEKASRMSAFTTESTPYAFQQISTPVDLSLPEDDRKAPVEQIYAKIKERRVFLAQSGLPILDPFTPPTSENRDWKKMDQKYRQFLIAQQGHRDLPIFRRLGSVVILKDFALLADEDPAAKQAVAFYTNELWETDGHAKRHLCTIAFGHWKVRGVPTSCGNMPKGLSRQTKTIRAYMRCARHLLS